MTGRRKSLAAVFSFSDKKDMESRHNSIDGNAAYQKKELPYFGSISLKRVLSQTEKPGLISVSPSTAISHALDIMKSNKIFSLPLKSRSKPGRFIGIVSAQDLLHYILSKCNQSLNEDIAKVVFEDSIENVLSLDMEDESYRIWERDYRDTIEATALAFAKGYHRALVTDALGVMPTVILTQTDLILHAITCAETHKFSVDLNAPITVTMPYCLRQVVTLSKLESALTGFLRLQEKNIPAMPILDKEELIGTLSKSDLIGIDKDSFMKLSSPVLHYLRQSRSSQVICIPGDSIKNIMERMIENRVHRVWIVESEESDKVIGVVSQSKILGEILGVNHQSLGIQMDA